MEVSGLIWDDLKQHISPPEIDMYAKRIGIARINRNEEIYNELSTLRKLYNTMQNKLTEEIAKKTPSILVSAQRTTAIQKCIHFLDSLKEAGHFIETDNPVDKEIVKYLKVTRSDRPNSCSPISTSRPTSSLRTSRSVTDVSNSIDDVRALLDEEFDEMQTQVQEIRCSMFNVCDEYNEAKEVEPPTTESIEKFNKRLQQQDFTVRSMTKQKSAGVNRLRDSIQMNRLWE